jgi:DNA-binding phage protein
MKLFDLWGCRIGVFSDMGRTAHTQGGALRTSQPRSRAFPRLGSTVDFIVCSCNDQLMSKSTTTLRNILVELTTGARRKGLNDSAWAKASGISKETLSRLRRRDSCDFATLVALADAAGARLSVAADAIPVTDDGHYPAELSRDYECRLRAFCASVNLDPLAWTALGPAFFMAGLAVMLASADDLNRRALLSLAERLHPGASEVAVFSRWLHGSPLRPSRFLPMLAAQSAHAA